MIKANAAEASKTPSGVTGFDEITGGGIPRGRVTTVMGRAGSGKTIFALAVLLEGAKRQNESGIFVAFEESVDHIISDSSSFDWNIKKLRNRGIEFVDAQLPQPLLQVGDFDLEGLLSMLDHKVKTSQAKRIVFDGLDVLLAVLGDPALIRREVFRLRDWLLRNKLTGIITTKAGAIETSLTRDYEFLQFMSDCVVSLDHTLTDSTAMRTIRVSKLRGAAHSANVFPFAMTRQGIEVASGASRNLNHIVLNEKIDTGVERLDVMLGGGYFRGSSVLISGVPGTAKTTLSGAFAEAAARRGERTLLVTFDESAGQIVRNLTSVNIHLAPHVKSGVLQICSLRARSESAESHIAHIRDLLREHKARNLVVDPISAFAHLGEANAAENAAIEVLDHAKTKGITTVSTTLLSQSDPLLESTSLGISTIADTWLHLSYVNQSGERNRALTIVKSRGSSHSNQVREFIVSERGLALADVYTAGGEVLMGTLRWEKEREQLQKEERERLDSEQAQRRAALALSETDARMEILKHERSLREAEIERINTERLSSQKLLGHEKQEMLRLRSADKKTSSKNKTPPLSKTMRRK